MIEIILTAVAFVFVAFFGGKRAGKRAHRAASKAQDTTKANKIRKAVYDVETNAENEVISDDQLDERLRRACDRFAD